jgi:hypothetical protein
VRPRARICAGPSRWLVCGLASRLISYAMRTAVEMPHEAVHDRRAPMIPVSGSLPL